jgi:hypothetical protein
MGTKALWRRGITFNILLNPRIPMLDNNKFSKQLVERSLNVPNPKKWYVSEAIDMPITLIWSLYIVFMYWNATLYLKNMSNYYI